MIFLSVGSRIADVCVGFASSTFAFCIFDDLLRVELGPMSNALETMCVCVCVRESVSFGRIRLP